MATKASIARREAEAARQIGEALDKLATAAGIELEPVPARYYADRDYRRMVAVEVQAANLTRIAAALEAPADPEAEPEAEPEPEPDQIVEPEPEAEPAKPKGRPKRG